LLGFAYFLNYSRCPTIGNPYNLATKTDEFDEKTGRESGMWAWLKVLGDPAFYLAYVG
jgi:hypothetical protein